MFNYKITTAKKTESCLKKEKLSPEIIEIYKKLRPHTFNQSLYGRYAVFQLAKLPANKLDDFMTKSLVNFHYKNFYWSTSHKRGMIGAVTDKKPVGIDIEVMKKTSKELFNIFTAKEWKLLGGKNWLNFYKAWTAKEAAIKALSLKLEDMKSILIKKAGNNEIVLRYKNIPATAKVFIDGKIICSVSRRSDRK